MRPADRMAPRRSTRGPRSTGRLPRRTWRAGTAGMDSSHRNGQKNGASNRSARTPAPSARRPGTRSQVSGRVRVNPCRGSARPSRGPVQVRRGFPAAGRHLASTDHTAAARPRSGPGYAVAIKEGSRMPRRRTITLEPYRGQWPPDDADAGFRQLVSEYSAIDPMPTLEELGRRKGIPVGALVAFVLARYCASGSEALLYAGPVVVRQMDGDRPEGGGDRHRRRPARRLPRPRRDRVVARGFRWRTRAGGPADEPPDRRAGPGPGAGPPRAGGGASRLR